MATTEILIRRVVRREIDISAAVMDCYVRGNSQGFIKSCQRVVDAAKVYEKYLGVDVFADKSVKMDVKLEKLSTRELQDLINELSHLVPK